MSWLKYRDTKYQLTSGEQSHWYIDADVMFENEHIRDAVLAEWWSYIRYLKKVLLVPVPTGGTKWASAFAEKYGFAMSSSVPTDYNGALVIVEDVITTGASVKKVCENPFWVVCVADRSTAELDLRVSSWVKFNFYEDLSS